MLRAILVATLTVIAIPATAVAAQRQQTAVVPADFAPSSASWTSADVGWVLGFNPCDGKLCPTIVRTTDGGETWQRRTAPPIRSLMPGENAHIVFSDQRNGVATSGARIYVTNNGSRSWQRVSIPAKDPYIASIAANQTGMYAVVSAADATTLYAARQGSTVWQAIAGLHVGGGGGWDVAARGVDAAAALGVVFESNRYWTANSDHGFLATTRPCDTYAAVEIAITPTGRAMAACSFEPGHGKMAKELMIGNPDTGFRDAGPAPYDGITTDFAAATTRTAVVAAVGADSSDTEHAFLHATFDGGRTWSQPLVRDGLPFSDLAFVDPTHGSVVYGGPRWPDAVVYRTTDGGHTWQPLSFS